MAEPCEQSSVLVIAGTDSSGKAGLVRDLATLHDHNIKPLIAVTAITAQSDDKVYSIEYIRPEVVAAQITAALADNSLRAIKIGMLGRAETVETVVKTLHGARDIPIICDPVLRSSSGTELLDRKGLVILRNKLLPLCQLVTPNLSEATVLGDFNIPTNPSFLCSSQESMPEKINKMGFITNGKFRGMDSCDEHRNDGTGNETNKTHIALAQSILNLGVKAVLAKGGHATGPQAVDVLYRNNLSSLSFSAPRLDINRRGTGCTLASAIAANLANGLSLENACQQAKNYLTDWLKK